MRCHKGFDTRHGDFVELHYSFISGRRYIAIGPVLPLSIYFEGPFCSWKGELRIYKNWAQKVREGPRNSFIVWFLQPVFATVWSGLSVDLPWPPVIISFLLVSILKIDLRHRKGGKPFKDPALNPVVSLIPHNASHWWNSPH